MTSTFHFFADFPNCAFTMIYIAFFLVFFFFIINLMKYLGLFLSKLTDGVIHVETFLFLLFRPMRCKEVAICKLRWNYLLVIQEMKGFIWFKCPFNCQFSAVHLFITGYNFSGKFINF
jgi:hypothetical protein